MATYEIESLIKKSLFVYLTNLYTDEGYTVGHASGQISIVPTWKDVDFTLPSIAIGTNNDRGYSVTGIGHEYTRTFALELDIFARTQLEREKLTGIFIDYSRRNALRVYDYNAVSVVLLGYARLYNQTAVPNVVNRLRDELENITTVAFDADYRESV